ncbi:hypothetical protein LIA77_09409 [Sarocladium implicatum]|nr:hypothetical protein LIA77_09409 [Sarocladium implicatum]
MRRVFLLAGTALPCLTTSQTTSSDPWNPEVEDDAPKLAPGCYPTSNPSAPCNQIAIIESTCMQRGISFPDHQLCMCSGSYFSDWRGCQACLRVQGVRGEGEVQYWQNIMDGASSSLCDSGAEPTTWLNEMFAWEAVSGAPRTGERAEYERTTFIGGTTVAVSEYYTAPEEQGPGITPTISPQRETETTSTSESATERETESGRSDDDDDEDGDDGAAGKVHAGGAAAIAMIMAGVAAFAAM